MRLGVMLLAVAGLTMGGAAYAQSTTDADEDCGGIPCSEMPPPGQCRVWVEGVAASDQAPPVDCAEAEASAPEGARVIYGELG